MIHNTHFAQYIPPVKFHIVAATNITDTAGAVAGTIAKHKAAAAETILINIPVEVPSNSIALQGAKLASIEVDYEITVAALTSATVTLNKVTRGAESAVAVVAAITQTQVPSNANMLTVDKHKLVVTITTPIFLLNTEYVLLALSFVCPATTVVNFLSAVANFTLKA